MTDIRARREFLLLGGSLAGTSVVRASDVAAPADARPALVLVHGAWHSSYCWCEVADSLRADGFRVGTPDLPGHGMHARYPTSYFTAGQMGFDTEPSPLQQVTLDDAARTVITALEQAQGRVKPVLVGHSLGGSIITRAAEMAPQLIGRLVYVSAFLPTQQPSPAALYALPEARTPYDAPITIGDAGRIGAVRFNPRGSIEYLRRLQSVFYQDVSEERFLPFASALSPDLPLHLWSGNLGRPRRAGGASNAPISTAPKTGPSHRPCSDGWSPTPMPSRRARARKFTRSTAVIRRSRPKSRSSPGYCGASRRAGDS